MTKKKKIKKSNLVCRAFQLFTSKENRRTWCAKAHLPNGNSRARPLPVLSSFPQLCLPLTNNTPNPKSLLTGRAYLRGTIIAYPNPTPFPGSPFEANVLPDPCSQSLPCKTAVTEFQWYLQFILKVLQQVHTKAADVYPDCQEQQGFKLNLVINSSPLSSSGAWYFNWPPGNLLGRTELMSLHFLLFFQTVLHWNSSVRIVLTKSEYVHQQYLY